MVEALSLIRPGVRGAGAGAGPRWAAFPQAHRPQGPLAF